MLTTTKEFGLGRNRRIAVSETIQANIELLSKRRRESLIDIIKVTDTITLHDGWTGTKPLACSTSRWLIHYRNAGAPTAAKQ
ncbi:phage integrase Arm DNA-binding domain-containing protein [Escherichia albertii]|uniref:phage integrase Arm DNA-binding domain-containing protein n=1 Tax=Escherichia albertii TaxID=208962 RepID=UPI003081239A